LRPKGEFWNRLERALDLSKNVSEPAKNDLDNSPLIRSGFKTSLQAQFLCWTEGFNTRNIKYIPALESIGPP
jgi:hypothetical protein